MRFILVVFHCGMVCNVYARPQPGESPTPAPEDHSSTTSYKCDDYVPSNYSAPGVCMRWTNTIAYETADFTQTSYPETCTCNELSPDSMLCIAHTCEREWRPAINGSGSMFELHPWLMASLILSWSFLSAYSHDGSIL